MIDSGPDDDIRQEMRRLSETSESRRVQVRQTNKQLKKAQQTLKELRRAIKLKVLIVITGWNLAHIRNDVMHNVTSVLNLRKR